MTTFKALTGRAPNYIKDLLTFYVVGRSAAVDIISIVSILQNLCEYLMPALNDFKIKHFIPPSVDFLLISFILLSNKVFYHLFFNTNTHCYQLTTQFITLINSTQLCRRITPNTSCLGFTLRDRGHQNLMGAVLTSPSGLPRP